MIKLSSLPRNNINSNLKIAGIITGITILTIGSIYVFLGVAKFILVWNIPFEHRAHYGLCMFYLGVLITLSLYPYISRYWRLLNGQPLYELDLANDCLYAYLAESKVKYNSELKDLVASWKFEKNKSSKETLMKKISKELDGDKFYSSDDISREDGLKNPALIGCLIHFIKNHTQYFSEDTTTKKVEFRKLQSQKYLLEKLEIHYGLKESRLKKRFAEANSAFDQFSTNYLSLK